MQNAGPTSIFIAYSSKDLAYKEEIRKRLKPLLRAGKVTVWDNYDIEAGKDWDAEIREKFSVNPPSVYGYGHQAFLQDVVRCLNGEIKNPVDGVEGKKSLELITAIYESIETKMPVHFPFTPKKSKLGHKLGHQLGHQLGQSR